MENEVLYGIMLFCISVFPPVTLQPICLITRADPWLHFPRVTNELVNVPTESEQNDQNDTSNDTTDAATVREIFIIIIVSLNILLKKILSLSTNQSCMLQS